MSLAEQIIVLSGTWVQSRKQIGRNEILMCECAPALSRPAVRAEIGDQEPFDIYQVKNGIGALMKAIRIGRSLIIWQAQSVH